MFYDAHSVYTDSAAFSALITLAEDRKGIQPAKILVPIVSEGPLPQQVKKAKVATSGSSFTWKSAFKMEMDTTKRNIPISEPQQTVS